MGQDREEKILEGDTSISTSSDRYITQTLADLGAEIVGTNGTIINLPSRNSGKTPLEPAQPIGGETLADPVEEQPVGIDSTLSHKDSGLGLQHRNRRTQGLKKAA